MTIIYFLIVLGVLVFVHEFGHFIVAKLVGVRVEAFSIGYSPKIFGFKWGETEYRLSAIPLGGYCKMAGQSDVDPQGIEKNDDPAMFYNKKIWQRFLIVFAGPFMNALLCLLLLPGVFMIGKQQPAYFGQPPQIIGVEEESSAERAGLKKGDLIIAIDDRRVETWEDVNAKVILSGGEELDFLIKRDDKTLNLKVQVEEELGTSAGYVGIEPPIFFDNETVVKSVEPGSSSEAADLKPGDKILEIGGAKIKSWNRAVKLINRNSDKPLVFMVKRGEDILQRKTMAKYDESTKRWRIGLFASTMVPNMPMELIKYPFVAAVKMSLVEMHKLTIMIKEILRKLVTLQLSYKSLGGPVFIAQLSAASAESGLSSFLYFMAFLSFQLGVLNLFPIPILDGGIIVFLFFEKLLGKPLHINIQAVANYIGMALLLTLIVLITYNDLDRAWGIGKFISRIF